MFHKTCTKGKVCFVTITDHKTHSEEKLDFVNMIQMAAINYPEQVKVHSDGQSLSQIEIYERIHETILIRVGFGLTSIARRISRDNSLSMIHIQL